MQMQFSLHNDPSVNMHRQLQRSCTDGGCEPDDGGEEYVDWNLEKKKRIITY